MTKEFETFYGKINKIGENTLYVSIPEKLIKFTGLEKGMVVKVMIQEADVESADTINKE